MVNVLSAVLAAAAIAFYVLVYTMVLKRRTPQNIVWGGAAGCMPVLIGWAAVTGLAGLDALGAVRGRSSSGRRRTTGRCRCVPGRLRRRRGADAAGRARAAQVVARQIVAYSWAMVAALAAALAGRAGMTWFYAAVAAGAGCRVPLRGVRAARAGPPRRPRPRPMRLFHGSITYLSVLFLAVALDPLLHL